MTFTATPEPANIPPRVLLDIDSDVAGASFTSLTVTRNGDPILQQPTLGAEDASVYDYLAPFGEAVEYIADGEYLPSVAPAWTESWASLAAWTGDTGSWSLGAGDTVESSTANAAITRTAAGAIQRVQVTDPDYVRVELLTSGSVVVVSLAVTDEAVLVGDTTEIIAGTGSFELTLLDGTATAAGVGWSDSVQYTGSPDRVRIVSLGGSFSLLTSWSSTGPAHQVAVAPGGNIYTLDTVAKLVRKFNSAGVFQTSWTTTNTPFDLAVDSAENIYVTDTVSNLVRKYNSAGTAGITWGTTSTPSGIGIDSSDGIYVLTGSTVRKYTVTGTAGITWAAGAGSSILDASGTTIVTVSDVDGDVYRYNTSGTLLGSFDAPLLSDNPVAVAVDSGGTIYVSDDDTDVMVYTSSGAAAGELNLGVNTVGGVVVTAGGTVYVGDRTANTIKVYGATTGTIGTVVATPVAPTTHYREIATAQLDVDEAWLMHPSQPSLSVSIDPGPNQWRDDGINVAIESAQTTVAKSSQTLHYPIGRPRAVAISHGNRLDDEWALVLNTPRLEDRDAVRAIVRDQTPLLVRSPDDFGWDLEDGYYAVGDVDTSRPFAPLQFPVRTITLPLVPSDPPVVRQSDLRTYASLLLESADYSGLIALYDTYTDLLAGND